MPIFTSFTKPVGRGTTSEDCRKARYDAMTFEEERRLDPVQNTVTNHFLSEYENPQQLRIVLEYIFLNKLKYRRVGSSMLPGVIYNDVDILVEHDDGLKALLTRSDLWTEGGSSLPEQQFTSFKTAYARYGDHKNVPLNVIMAHSDEFYETFSSSQDIVENAKLTAKEDRVAVFSYMRDEEGKCSLERFTELALGINRTEEDTGAF